MTSAKEISGRSVERASARRGGTGIWSISQTGAVRKLPLVAEFDLKIPGWVSNAGRRVVLPVGVFTGVEKHIFEHANRVHPIYFEYPYEKEDDVTIDLPAGMASAA